MIWSLLHARAAECTLTPEASQESLLRALRGALPRDAPFAEDLLLPLAWLAFRFCAEANDTSRVQVPLRMTLMARGEASLADLIADLEALDPGDPEELAELALSPISSVLEEIAVARQRPLLTERSAPLDAVMDTIEPGPSSPPELAPENAILAEARSSMGSNPGRALALATRCANNVELTDGERACALSLAGDCEQDLPQAVAHYEAALRLDPVPDVAAKLGGVLVDLGRVTEGLDWLERALGDGVTSPATAYFSVGLGHLSGGDDRRAERAFGHVLAYAPDHEDSRMNRFVARSRLGELEAALRDARRLTRWSPRGHQLEAAVLNKLGDLDGALAAANQYVDAGLFFDAALARALVRRSRNEHELAERDCDEVLRQEPDDPLGRLERACARAERDVGGALEDLAVVLQPEAWQKLEDTVSSKLWSGPFASRSEAEVWRGRLLAKLLPLDSSLQSTRELLEAGNLREALQSLIEIIEGHETGTRAAAAALAPAILRGLGQDPTLSQELRALRMLL